MCISAACCERPSAFSQTHTHPHHRLILKGRTQSSPTGYLERSEIAATRLFRDHDDWARATDTQSRPSVPVHGEEPYRKEFRYVNANRSKIPLGKSRRATGTVLPTERDGAQLSQSRFPATAGRISIWTRTARILPG